MSKPLGCKAYGSIPHLPNSRMGPSDHHCHSGQATICCTKARDKHDIITVQEKLDGSCCAVAKVSGIIMALGRSGHMAYSSPYEQHHFFGVWVDRNRDRFDKLLEDGERVVGEWLALAHGTRYELHHEPFVAFDIINQQSKRSTYNDFVARATEVDLVIPRLIHRGDPFSVKAMLDVLEPSGHGAIDPVEGAVWRVERNDPNPNGKGLHVDCLCKWVRQDKVDGKYLPEVSGQEPIWHWRP